ncbi:hypothetical protein SOVF_099860 [Spinacia oleracea]|nr:hypothetical protein SOVF_099860 [Spinacia oleracea]
MACICPIDLQFAPEISALLQSPPSHETQEYFDNLIAERPCHGVKVKLDGELGKGVYADAEFKDGELVLKDQILVGSQHSTNKMDCFVCGSCFRFIGSIELQIGRKLYFKGLGASSSNHCHSDSSDEEDNSCAIEDANLGECSASVSKGGIALSQEFIESLMGGQLLLPYSEKFSLPSLCPCPGGCGEEFYCSKSCADIDWETCHSLLCSSEKSKPSCRRALSKFVEHANDTNDIFILAAKVIAMTSLRYKSLKEAHLKEVGSIAPRDATVNLSLLLEAWKPVSLGYKKRWWDCIALPEDVENCNEAVFRLQLKELAFESLQLLKEAIFDEECAPLFSLEIYGHIVGMFELNNLDLVVASPVEDYFLYVDDLPGSPKKAAEAVTRPILDALDDGYSICCEGTAFFPLQSCMNHSCCPNAKAFKRDNDRDGQATIIALRPIQIGEEVTISYIDEDLPYEERQKLLADYGFRCKCLKCLEEKAN